MSDTLPPHLRPITFAANELLLDMIYLLQSYCKQDLESVAILLCVTDATMRPFMTGGPVTPEVLLAERPSEDIRGSISRRMIADKTGLSRETVRRKTLELAQAGFVLIDAKDRIRSAQRLGDPAFQNVVESGHRAVLTYIARLKAFDVPLDCVRA